MRFGQALVLLLVAAFVFAGTAASTHDHGHPFAGEWILDPVNRPAPLRLHVVPDAEGIEAMRLIHSNPRLCAGPTDYYKGDFSTPNDAGLVVGCTRPSSGVRFDGIYRSLRLRPGLVGRLVIELSYRSNGDVDVFALITDAGNELGSLIRVPIKFHKHGPNDGAVDPSAPKPATPLPLKRGRATVAYVDKLFAPSRLEVANGTVLTLCNREGVVRHPFSFPKTGPNAFTKYLRPGQCVSHKLVNHGKTRITVKVYDHISSRAKLEIVIHPPGV